MNKKSIIYEKNIEKYLIEKYSCIQLTLNSFKKKYFEAECFILEKKINFSISYNLNKITEDSNINGIIDEYLKSFEFRFYENIDFKDLCILFNLLGYNKLDYIYNKAYNEISFFHKNIKFNHTLYFKNNGELKSFTPFSNLSIIIDEFTFFNQDDLSDLLVSNYLFNKNNNNDILKYPVPLINESQRDQIDIFLNNYRQNKSYYFNMLAMILI